MAGFSEKELLLLVNYEYFYCSTNEGTIKENIEKLKNQDGSYDMEKVVSEGATGDIISEDDAVDILSRLENDEKLSGLHAARTINRGGLRATLFTNDDESNSTLVFRGTGGTYKAWEDNVLGEYETDTRIQKLAKDFVKYECGDFKNITVTGHSKGGNLAQYVTIVCGDQISKCVSYDGQGFGKNFINEHEEEIALAKKKITSISAFNDFVNILLTPVAGTILYVKNEEGLSVNMHSCYTMLSNGSFTEDGSFKRDFGVIPQLPAMTMAKWTADGMVSLMGLLPKDGEEKATNVLAAWVASIFSGDRGEEFEKERINTALSEFKSYAGEILGIADLGTDTVKYSCNYLMFYIEKIYEAYNILEEATNKMRVYPEIVEDILVRLDYSILGRSFTENALKKIIDKLDRTIRMIDKLRLVLKDIIHEYEIADRVT